MLETSEQHAGERAAMVEEQVHRRGISDARVLAAMCEVPREEFVRPDEREHAFEDCALPLDHGQTISQPYMVARAAELAQLAPSDVALEVGLGSGYQSAVLSRLCARVVGLEYVPELATAAGETLARVGIDNVEVVVGDGSQGHAAGAPYDAIVVSAGAPRVPDALVAQLRVGGRLVIPVGPRGSFQTLSVVTRTATGCVTDEYDRCVYVPLLGAAGHN